jgi:hypothetical protein
MSSVSNYIGHLRTVISGVCWHVVEVLICASAILIYMLWLPVLLYNGELSPSVINDMRATFADLLGHEQRKPLTEAEVEAHLQREITLHMQELERQDRRT